MKTSLGFNRPTQQAGALHKPAANRVLEILYLVAVGRPVQGVRMGQTHHWGRLALAFRVVPDPAVAVAVRMARCTGDPALARQGRQGGAEKNLALYPFRRLRRLA